MNSLAGSSPTCFPSETRIPIENVEELKTTLDSFKAVHKGSYAFIDKIYKGEKELEAGYWRLRAYSDKGSWSDCSDFEVSERIYKKGYKLCVKTGFSTEKDAEEFIPVKGSSFFIKRKGDEYELDGLRLFVEDINALEPSIEIVLPITKPTPAKEDADSKEKVLSEAAENEKKNIQKVKELVARIGLDYSKRYLDSLPLVYASRIGL